MTEYKRIAIMGAGSMGTLFGACLTKAGVPCDLIDIDRAHVDALNQSGATITGTVEFTVPVKALLPEQMKGKYDLVFLMTKKTANDLVLPRLHNHLHPDGIVCTMQHGLPESALISTFGRKRTMGCIVNWAATYLEPGKTESDSAPEKWLNILGRPDGKITDEVKAVGEVLRKVCPTELTDNLSGIRWSRLLVGSAINGMSTVLGCTFGELAKNPVALTCARHVAGECVRVSKSLNIPMESPVPGHDLDILDAKTDSEIQEAEALLQKLLVVSRSGKSSMLQDLEHGRHTEIDELNGALCNVAWRSGIQVPLNDRVCRLVKEMEAGREKPGMEQLEKFSDLIR